MPAGRFFQTQPRFCVLTAYAVKASALTLYYAVNEIMQGFPGKRKPERWCCRKKAPGGCYQWRFLRAGAALSEGAYRSLGKKISIR